MEEEKNSKLETKDTLISIIKRNKKTIIIFLSILLILFFSFIILNLYYEKRNISISEKYIKAGLYLANGKKNESLNLYKDIIIRKNKFYSILALNTILEKELEKDKNIILNYFKTIEELNIPKDQKDLLKFKKALYLIKNSEKEKGDALLKNLMESESKFQKLVEDVIIE